MTLTDVQEVGWDLDPLVDGDGPEGADRLLDEADERAARFAESYAGRVDELDGAGLAAAMAELETIVDRLGRAGYYAMLRFAVDTADPDNGALLARVQERATAVETKLLFFELEWAAIDDDRVEELLSGRRAGHDPPPPAHAAPLPPAPALRARGEAPDREGASPAATRGRGCSPS